MNGGYVFREREKELGCKALYTEVFHCRGIALHVSVIYIYTGSVSF